MGDTALLVDASTGPQVPPKCLGREECLVPLVYGGEGLAR